MVTNIGTSPDDTDTVVVICGLRTYIVCNNTATLMREGELQKEKNPISLKENNFHIMCAVTTLRDVLESIMFM